MENKIYPFKFLDAYTPNDKDIFFGRDEETRDLYEMLKQSDILLVYGASGTGKTSLIQCGLSKKLSDYDWLPFYIRRGSNLNVSLLNNLQKLMPDNENSAGDFLDELLENPTSPNPTENEVVKAIRNIYSNWFKPVYLIFDQFEELFVLGTSPEQRQFVQTINDILAARQNVKLIFSIREEYLGHLYQFEKAVPQLLRKKMRVEAMHFEKVAQIVAGINNYGQSNIAIEKTNIEHFTTQLFEKIKAEKELTVQLPYLQVFLDKLYLNITADKSRQAPAVFTSAALDKLGDIGDVLSEFLEEQVLELSAELRKTFPEAITEKLWEILSAFATLEGTKEPLSMLQLYDLLPQTKKPLIDAVSQAFTDRRILRYNETDELYELAHDALAKRVAEKRSEDEIALLQARQLIKSQSTLKAEARELFTEKQLALIAPFTEKLKLTPDEQKLIADSHTSIELKRTEKIRRQRKIISFFILAALVSIVFGIYGIVQKNRAEKQTEKARMALQQVKKEKENVDKLLIFANLLFEGYHFYDNKYAVKNMGYGNAYFIDKNGNKVKKFGTWDKIEQFNITLGFAKVSKEKYIYDKVGNLFFFKEYYILDTVGNLYRTAYSINELSDKIEALDLSEKRFTTLPQSIFKQKQLKILIASHSNLYFLQKKIKNLKTLIKLYLPSNNLTNLPNEIGDLVNLTIMDLSSNNLSNLPSEIGNLSNLTKIDLSNNNLKNLPSEIGNLSNLTELNISSNRLTKLPHEIGKLTNLVELYLSFNSSISDIHEIGSLLNLSILDLSANGLKELPHEIFALQNLTFLDLGRNQLSILPSEIGKLYNLKRLRLDMNQLTTLPPEIKNCKSLKQLDLYNNNFSTEERQKIESWFKGTDCKIEW